MIEARSFAGKSAAVFGMGMSGIAAARSLLAGGAKVLAWDDGERGREAARAAGLPLCDLHEADWSAIDALVLAPGVPLTHPEPHWTVKLAREHGVEVIGDTEIFIRERKASGTAAKVIAITGTNGKSTTTALTHHILTSIGEDAVLGGNIGKAVLDLPPFADGRYYVIEFSSFQLDLTPSLDADAAILLNVTPDHIDRHGSLENYAAVKETIFRARARRRLSAPMTVFCDAIAERAIARGVRTFRISASHPVKTGIYAEGSELFEVADGAIQSRASLSGIGSLRGAHNAQNAAAALAALRSLCLSWDKLAGALRSFPGLAHRMEEVRRIGDVLFVNDSKATNADAAERALLSFSQHLLDRRREGQGRRHCEPGALFPPDQEGLSDRRRGGDFCRDPGTKRALHALEDARPRRRGSRRRCRRRCGGRGGGPAVAGLRVLRSIPQFRGAGRRIPRICRGLAGEARRGPRRMKFSRAERAHVADWWLSIDRTLLMLIVTLAVCGLAASLIASPSVGIHLKGDPFYFVKRQAAGMVFALAFVFIVSLLNPSQMKRLALLLFIGGSALMALALFQGAERNGATRWLILAGAVIQPSEFVKPGFVVLTAWLFAESVKRPDMPALELSLLMLAIFLSLLVLQPDMGQAIIAACVWCGILFLAGYSLRLLPAFLLLGAGGVTAAYFTMPHFTSRLNRFMQGPGDSMQTSVAVNAFREAGWLGHGLGEGFTKSRLPDAHNDFVFAAIAEETGIAACLFLILIYALIVWRVLRRAFREEDAFVRLAAAGLVMIFGLQALINMAVNLNLLPAKGVTLPLISYGRSSLIASAITLGMIAGLTRRPASRLASQSMQGLSGLT